jgi:hypothetical protein
MGKAIFKLVIGLVVGGGLWFTAKAMGFPPVFQWAFFGYAAIGTVVFLLLDIPSMKPQGGWARLSPFSCSLRPLCWLRRRRVSFAAI